MHVFLLQMRKNWAFSRPYISIFKILADFLKSNEKQFSLVNPLGVHQTMSTPMRHTFYFILFYLLHLFYLYLLLLYAGRFYLFIYVCIYLSISLHFLYLGLSIYLTVFSSMMFCHCHALSIYWTNCRGRAVTNAMSTCGPTPMHTCTCKKLIKYV